MADLVKDKSLRELKDLCRGHGLKVGGSKAELIARLKATPRVHAGPARGAPREGAPPAVAAEQYMEMLAQEFFDLRQPIMTQGTASTCYDSVQRAAGGADQSGLGLFARAVSKGKVELFFRLSGPSVPTLLTQLRLSVSTPTPSN